MKLLNLFFGFILLLFQSCSKNDSSSDNRNNLADRTLNGSEYGAFHNHFLGMAYNDFVFDANLISKEQAYNAITSFYQEKIDHYTSINSTEKNEFKNEFKINKHLLDTHYVQQVIKNQELVQNPIIGRV